MNSRTLSFVFANAYIETERILAALNQGNLARAYGAHQRLMKNINGYLDTIATLRPAAQEELLYIARTISTVDSATITEARLALRPYAYQVQS